MGFYRWHHAIVLAIVLVASSAYGHKTNPLLAYTMKTISKDVAFVADPTKKASPADVTDGQILTAIVRVRTTTALLQLAIDRRERELLPPRLDEIADPVEKKRLFDLYVTYLAQAKEKLEAMEKVYIRELAKTDPEARDFGEVKKGIVELESLIVEAHKVFRP